MSHKNAKDVKFLTFTQCSTYCQRTDSHYIRNRTSCYSLEVKYVKPQKDSKNVQFWHLQGGTLTKFLKIDILPSQLQILLLSLQISEFLPPAAENLK